MWWIALLFLTVVAPSIQSSKVAIVVFENEDVYNVEHLPGFAEIAANGIQFDGYDGVTHPSQFNYFAMVGLRDDYPWHEGTDEVVHFRPSARTIVDAIEAAGKTWTVYLEDYPLSSGCFTGSSGDYVRRHHPFISFLSVKGCSHYKHADWLERDIVANQLADYIFYVPDVCNDGHDQCVEDLSSREYMSEYVVNTWLPLLNDPVFMADRTTFFIFDESGFDRQGQYTSNPIYAVAYDGYVKGRVNCQGCNHRNLLATSCHLLGIDCRYLTKATAL